MNKSVFWGSAVSVLLTLSAISYARPLIQGQEPSKSTIQTGQPVQSAANNIESAKPEGKPPTSAPAATVVAPADDGKSKSPSLTTSAAPSVETAAQSYVATAYSLRGRTASGKPVSRGLIAADPAVLPLGTRVRVEAGSFSGEYLVADTGGGVKGRHIDIWTPNAKEARRFGRRSVKLTVLALGAKREVRTRARRKN